MCDLLASAPEPQIGGMLAVPSPLGADAPPSRTALMQLDYFGESRNQNYFREMINSSVQHHTYAELPMAVDIRIVVVMYQDGAAVSESLDDFAKISSSCYPPV